jgi:hypothetical protein
MDIEFFCVADGCRLSAVSLQLVGIGFQDQLTNTDSGKALTFKDIARLIAES